MSRMSQADSRVGQRIRASVHLYTACEQSHPHFLLGIPMAVWVGNKDPSLEAAANSCVSFTTHSVNFVKWSSQGMLRMSCEAMNELFHPTVSGIIQHIGERTEPHSSPTSGSEKNSHLCLHTTILHLTLGRNPESSMVSGANNICRLVLPC